MLFSFVLCSLLAGYATAITCLDGRVANVVDLPPSDVFKVNVQAAERLESLTTLVSDLLPVKNATDCRVCKRSFTREVIDSVKLFSVTWECVATEDLPFKGLLDPIEYSGTSVTSLSFNGAESLTVVCSCSSGDFCSSDPHCSNNAEFSSPLQLMLPSDPQSFSETWPVKKAKHSEHHKKKHHHNKKTTGDDLDHKKKETGDDDQLIRHTRQAPAPVVAPPKTRKSCHTHKKPAGAAPNTRKRRSVYGAIAKHAHAAHLKRQRRQAPAPAPPSPVAGPPKRKSCHAHRGAGKPAGGV